MSTLIGSMIDALTRNPENCTIVASKKERRFYGTKLRDTLLDSHRFHLSSKTALVASKLAMEAKDTYSIMSLAQPPFIRTWLEWNLADQFAGVGMVPAGDAPSRIGVMVFKGQGSEVLITSVLPVTLDGREVVISPVSILFDPEKPVDKKGQLSAGRDIMATCLMDNVVINDRRATHAECLRVLDATMVGGHVDNDNNPVTFEQETLIAHASWIFTPYYSEPYTRILKTLPDRGLVNAMTAIISERVTESSGLLRFVVGALALINSKEYIHCTTVKPGQKNAPEAPKDGKRSPKYEFVEFTAPHKVFVRDIIESQTTEEDPTHKRPQHEVMGHYAHSRKLGRDDCEHNYEKRAENSWICLNCGKKRWHRKEHLRGDPAIGVVERKERVVIS